MKKNNFRLQKYLYFFIIIVSFASCDFIPTEIRSFNLNNLNYDMEDINSPEINNRQWSILIYMAADNDLEAAAIEDIYEMEISRLNTNKVSVFILLDRSNSYDTSNENWSGSRLYKLKTGRSKDCKTIISEEISCDDLDLVKDRYTELDMSSKYTLSKALNFIKKQYPAEQLGLIMWGHGTGWRGEQNQNITYKGFAYDDSTGSYMTLKQLGDGVRDALDGDILDFIGLDTCFSAELEVMYELKDTCKVAVGTEGLLLLSGWDYETIFNKINHYENKTPTIIANICIEAFSREYELASDASIAAVNMAFVNDYFLLFDLIMKNIANKINDKGIRDILFTSLFSKENSTTKSYSYGKENSDVYLDIESTINTCKKIIGENDDFLNLNNSFEEIKQKCIFNSWASDKVTGGLGVYFGTLTAGNLIASVHDKSYIKNGFMEQIQFVEDSNGYVPGQKEKDSFIDKLFYTDY